MAAHMSMMRTVGRAMARRPWERRTRPALQTMQQRHPAIYRRQVRNLHRLQQEGDPTTTTYWRNRERWALWRRDFNS